ncbi:hypothetical protein GGF31_003715 [Allomyces arbusculus]|nr:hypothetical protein GGF31_003715 [Allomyces arbusculus]
MRRTSMPAAARPPSPARLFHHHHAATATASNSSSSAAPTTRGGAAIRGRIRRFHSALDAAPIPLVPVARAPPHRASTSGLPPTVPASTPAALAVHLIPLRRSPSPASSSRGGRAGSTNTATTTDGTGHALVHHHPHHHHLDDAQLQDIGTSSGPPLLPTSMAPALPLPGAPGSQLPLVPAIKSFLWSLFQMVVWFGTAICLILTGVDLFVQALDKPPPTAMYLQLIIVGSYALLVTAALLFSFSRFMTVRTALALLPKLYVPTSVMDLPHHVHAHIATSLDRALSIARTCGPAAGTPSAAVEWGDPDSPLAETQFRDAAVASLDLLADRLAPFPHVARMQPVAARPPPPPRGPGRPVSAAPAATSLSGVTSTSAGTAPWIPRTRAPGPVAPHPAAASAPPAPRLRALPVRAWFRRLVAARLVDKRLAKRYLDTYDRARWGRAPITVDEYLAFMKVLAMILQGLPPPPLTAGGMAAPLIEVEPGVP